MRLNHVATRHGSLAVRSWGGAGPPLVCLHGFTLHGGMFSELAELVDRPVVAPDLPGHGATEVAPVRLEPTLGALAAWLETVGKPVALLGYSQGGRIGLHLALRRPDLMTGLVVVSAGPGLDEAGRQRRRIDDVTLADRIETIGLAAFLDEWLAHPLVGTRDRPNHAKDRARREENTSAGLAAALRGLGQGSLPRIDLTRLEVPTQWVAGGRDPRYTAIAEEGAETTGGELIVVTDSGHNVVADAPAELAEVIARLPAQGRRQPS